jgi:hypothetical protein
MSLPVCRKFARRAAPAVTTEAQAAAAVVEDMTAAQAIAAEVGAVAIAAAAVAVGNMVEVAAIRADRKGPDRSPAKSAMWQAT